MDTVSVVCRPEGRRALHAVDGFLAKPHRGGAAGARVADERGPDGGRMICFPPQWIFAYETRLGALVAGDRENHDLTRPGEVFSGGGIAAELLSEYSGTDVGAAREVRRFDLASELRFDRSSDGLAFLRGVSGICPPRMRNTLEVAGDGSVMTVYVKTAKRGVVKARIYDKGRESGSDPPGRRVRIEAQERPPRSKRYSPEAFVGLDLTTTFGRTMQPYLQAEQVTLTGPDGAVAELLARAVRRELSHARAERLAGAASFLKFAGRAAYVTEGDSVKRNNERSSRRLKALRDAGIVLADELPAESVLPVSELLRDAIERFGSL
jgi:hypothetical protein